MIYSLMLLATKICMYLISIDYKEFILTRVKYFPPHIVGAYAPSASSLYHFITLSL